MLRFRVYAGPHNECYIPQQVVADAHIEIGPKNKPAIIFRIAAKNEKVNFIFHLNNCNTTSLKLCFRATVRPPK